MKKEVIKTRNIYLAVSILTFIFGIIYELCSHQVYSAYMLFAFALPLLGGFLPYMFFAIDGKSASPRPLSSAFYNAGIATATCGCIFRGIIEIYGTTSHLTKLYFIASIVLIALGITTYLVERVFHSSASSQIRI